MKKDTISRYGSYIASRVAGWRQTRTCDSRRKKTEGDVTNPFEQIYVFSSVEHESAIRMTQFAQERSVQNFEVGGLYYHYTVNCQLGDRVL